MVGAYQDVLGMKHNLFASPSEVNVVFENGKSVLKDFLPSQNIHDILEDLDYHMFNLQQKLFGKLKDDDLLFTLKKFLKDNGYLKIGMSSQKK